MSLIDTLAPIILAACFGLALVSLVGAWAYRLTSEARAAMLEKKHHVQLERQAYQFVEQLFIESNSVSSDVTLSTELSDELWKLHNQIDQHRELTR